MSDGVDLYWIPLGAGAGGAVVRWNGRLYESLAAALARRPRCDLFHSALEVHVDGVTAAKAAGCEWLHVDFCPEHRPFYFDACGFRPTDAGLIHLPSLK